MEDKTFLNYYLPSLLFNLFEIFIIVIVGVLFNVKLEYILAIFIAFILNKVIIGKGMHYKDWYICFIWSTLLFLSFYILSKVSIEIAILGTCTYVFLSERSNIMDLPKLFQWTTENKYQDISDYIKYNEFEDELISFEKKLEQQDKVNFLIYKYKFKSNLSYTKMSELLDMEPPRIAERVNKIAFAMRIYCKISAIE